VYGAPVPVDSAEDLYGLPLDQFTQERDALAKRLRADKERDEAHRVKRLRKPTVAAWAVNQLVRTQAKGIEALFEAGDAMTAAQAKGDADRLRRAGADQRDALASLMSRAEGLLDSDGHSLAAAVLEKVSETLRAAAIDPEAREQVEHGCLARELQLSGFLGAGPPAASKAGGAARKKKKQTDPAELKAAREREKRAERAVRETREELARAEGDLAQAEEELAAARERVEKLRHQER
jgi:hypothetical protein